MTPFWPDGQPVDVQANGEEPTTFRWRGRVHRVRQVSVHWRIHTNWWTETELWYDYWEVTTDSGLLCVLYRDLMPKAGISQDAWYLERIYA